MSQNDILRYLQRRPFEPFRLVISDGSRYEVPHPEMALVSPTSVVVGRPDPMHPGGIMDFDLVSMRHIVKIEPVPAAASKGNGEGSPPAEA